MKTILHGPVTEAHLADAALFSGIEPSEFITAPETVPPFSGRAPTVIPVDPMVGDHVGVWQQHWRMSLHADALICVGRNEHLCHVAERTGLLVYQVDV